METAERELAQTDRAARIETLVRELSGAQRALEELLAGEVDAVVDPVSGSPLILRHAQEALRRSEARMRLLLEQVPAVVWTIDLSLRLTSLSGGALHDLGEDADALAGRTVVQLAETEEGLAPLLAAHYRALEGQRASYEAAVRGRVLHGTVEPMVGEGGRIVGCVGVGLDVTARREAEEDLLERQASAARQELERLVDRSEALSPEHRTLVKEVLASSREAVETVRAAAGQLRQQSQELAVVHNVLASSQQRYRDLFESAPDGYVVTDLAGVMRRANRSAVALLGTPEETLRDEPLLSYVVEEDRAEFRRRLEEIRAGREAGKTEWEVTLRSQADGGVFPAALTVAPIERDDGDQGGLRWLLRDISLSKRVQERERLLAQAQEDREVIVELAAAVEQERDLLSTIMENVHAQVAYLDTSFRFVRVNAAYCRGTGHHREDLLGRNHFELFPDAENQAIFARVRDSGEAVSFSAKPFVFPNRPERETTYWDWTLVPVKERGGNVRGLVLSLHDVTDRERARQARLARLARLRTLVDASERILAETSIEGVLQQVVDAGRELTGAQIGTSGHGYREGVFRVSANSRAEDAPPCLSGKILAVERGGVYLDLVDRANAVRLTDEEMRAHPAWWGLLEGHAPLRGLLGARLVDHEGRANGLIMVSDKIEGDFTAEDEALLVQLATLTSLALVHIEARAESERLRRRNELILSSAGEGILGLDRHRNVAFANPAATKMLGWGAEELVGSRAHDIVHHTQLDGTPYIPEECLVCATLVDGATYSVSGEVFWRKDGTSFPVAYTSTPIVEGDEIYGGVLLFRDISEQQEAQRAIRAERERLEAVLQQLPEGVIIAEAPSGKLVLRNAQVAQIWGRDVGPVQNVDGYATYEGFHPDGSPYRADEWPLARTIAEGEVVEEEEIQFRRGDGSLGWMTVSSVPILDEQGQVIAGVATFSDVTSRKRAEEALRRYAQRLEVLHEADEAILSAESMERVAGVALEHMQRLIPFRRASVTLFDPGEDGISLLAAYPEEMAAGLGKRWQGTLLADSGLEALQRGQVHLDERLEGGDGASEFAQALRAQGVGAYIRVPLLVRDALIGSLNMGLAAAGEPDEETVAIAREVADELATGIEQARLYEEVQRHAVQLEEMVRRRTAALRLSQARFQSVFEEAAIGIALIDRRGRILDSNPALQRMLGYTREELQERIFADLAHPDNVRDDADLYRELIAGSRTHYRVEGRYLCKDGSAIHANLTVSLVRPRRGRARFAIALVEDVTERKEAEAALIESEKLALTGRLATSLAHEINNPLQSVIGCLSLAQEDLAAGADPSRFVQIAVEELDRAAGLVTRMRDLQRPSQRVERKPADVNALVERVLLLAQKRCQDRHVEVVWEGASDLPTLSLMAGRIQQVFLNLLLNAVDAMPDGGQLHVRTARTEAPLGVEIAFEDQGVGMSPEDMAHLFEPFHTTKALGLGLGLYVSQGIVSDHGGRIEVESREGEGSKFTLWLPA